MQSTYNMVVRWLMVSMSRTSLTIGKGTYIYMMEVFAVVVIVEQDLMSRCLVRVYLVGRCSVKVCLVKVCM
jgi:hypothetical protein